MIGHECIFRMRGRSTGRQIDRAGTKYRLTSMICVTRGFMGRCPHYYTLPWPKVVYIQTFKLDFLRNYCTDLNQILYESFQVQGNENLMI